MGLDSERLACYTTLVLLTPVPSWPFVWICVSSLEATSLGWNPSPPLTVTLQSLATSQNFLNFSALLYAHVYAQSLSCVPLFGTLQTVACQAPLSMEFSRQEYWSRLPFPPPEDLPDPGVNPASPASTGRFFTTATWEAPFIQGNKW